MSSSDEEQDVGAVSREFVDHDDLDEHTTLNRYISTCQRTGAMKTAIESAAESFQ